MSTEEPIGRPDHVPAERVVDFDLYRPLREGQDFHRSWRQLQDAVRHDVVWTPHNGGHWMVMRGPLVPQVLTDYANFSNRTVLVPKDTAGAAYRLIPLGLDPPAHAPFRSLLNSGLSPKAIAPVEARIRALCIELIENFRGDGHCDFTSQFAEQLPIRVFMQMVDLPIGDAQRLKHMADQFTRPDGSLTYEQVTARFHDYLGPIIEQRRGTEREDMLTRLINGRIGDRGLTDQEAIDLCEQVLVGGLDTVVNFLGFIMLFLARDSATRAALAADPSRIAGCLNEFVRRFPLVTAAREIARDVEFEGLVLKRGEMIVAPTVLHGLDPAVNPEPFDVNFKRAGARHSTFGGGVHTCPGAHLARTETRIMLEEWLARIPDFSVPAGYEIEYMGGVVGSVKRLPLEWQTERGRETT